MMFAAIQGWLGFWQEPSRQWFRVRLHGSTKWTVVSVPVKDGSAAIPGHYERVGPFDMKAQAEGDGFAGKGE